MANYCTELASGVITDTSLYDIYTNILNAGGARGFLGIFFRQVLTAPQNQIGLLYLDNELRCLMLLYFVRISKLLKVDLLIARNQYAHPNIFKNANR